MLAVLALLLQGSRSEAWLDIVCFESGKLCDEIEKKAKDNLKSDDYVFYSMKADDQKSKLKKCISKILLVVFDSPLSLDLTHLTKGKRWVWVEHESADDDATLLTKGLTRESMKQRMKQRRARRETSKNQALASAELTLPSGGGDISDRVKLLLISAVVEVKGDWTVPAVVFGDDEWIPSTGKKVKCTNLVVLEGRKCAEKMSSLPQDIFDSETLLVIRDDTLKIDFVDNNKLKLLGQSVSVEVDSKNRVRLGIDIHGDVGQNGVDLGFQRGTADPHNGLEIGVVDVFGELLKPFKDTNVFAEKLAAGVVRIYERDTYTNYAVIPIVLVGPNGWFDTTTGDGYHHDGIEIANDWDVQEQPQFWKIADDPGPGEKSSGGLSAGVIAAIVIVSLLVLIAIIVGVVCYMRHKNQKDKEKVDAEPGEDP
jgi:hypothetical protein